MLNFRELKLTLNLNFQAAESIVYSILLCCSMYQRNVKRVDMQFYDLRYSSLTRYLLYDIYYAKIIKLRLLNTRSY